MKSLRIRSHAQSGFTLIELIIVIVIVGILAVVALPKFTGISAQAATAATEGIAGNLASAASTNFALRSGGLGGTALTDCNTDVLPLLQTAPASYVVTGPTGIAVGANATCILTHPNGTTTVNFTVVGA